MYFNAAPWDIAKSRPYLISQDRKGLYGIHCFDPFIEKIFLNKIPKNFFGDEQLKVLNASEITVTWLEENIGTLDFFSTAQPYLVLFAETLSKDVATYLEQEDVDWGERYFILVFNKDMPLFSTLKKRKDTTAVKVEPPKFWETQKLIQFLCDQMRLKLPYNIQNFIVEAVPGDVGSYIQALKNIKLELGDTSQLSLKEVSRVVTRQRIDQFEVARLYGEKNFKLAFETLMSHKESVDGYISLFRFLQGHLVKVSDPSYINKKSKPSKYDKEIMSQSSLWNIDEIRKEMLFLNKCETYAKAKSYELTKSLRLRLVQSYHQ